MISSIVPSLLLQSSPVWQRQLLAAPAGCAVVAAEAAAAAEEAAAAAIPVSVSTVTSWSVGVSLSELLEIVDALCVIVETSKNELLVEAAFKRPDRLGWFYLPL